MAPTSAPTHSLARLLAIAAYTLLPLAGVLALGWDWREVIILYWLENLTLGAAMVIRLLRTRSDPGPEPMIINDRRVAQTPQTIGWLAGFFVLHYGLFTLVHGVFVFLIALHGIVDAYGWMLSARRANRPGSTPTVSVRLG